LETNEAVRALPTPYYPSTPRLIERLFCKAHAASYVIHIQYRTMLVTYHQCGPERRDF